MRQHLTPARKLRRFGVAMAVGALATIGLIPAVSASGASSAGSAAVAAPRASTCRWAPIPAQFWVLDPQAGVASTIWGNTNIPGQAGVAYKVTGQFSHSTTMVFTAYNNLVNIPSPAYVLNDKDIIPDPGSVNPFVPGTRVMGEPRNYTAWIWPDNVPVPAGLKNVVLYPTAAEDPGGQPGWSLTLRMYKMQPGYSRLRELPNLTAVSAANPSQSVRCPLTAAGAIASQVVRFFAHVAKYGPVPVIPEPPTGNKIYFTRIPAAYFVGLDGYPGPLPESCANYLVATLPVDQISVTTMHKVPEYFNNDLVTPGSVMKDYPIRYQSQTVNYFTLNTRLYRSLSVNTDNSVYTADGKWVTVYLPGDPRLTPSQERAVRAKAAALNYNVIQLPPRPRGPIARQIPYGGIALRQKGISPNFGLSNTNVPCWSEDHPYDTYPDQNSPEFFAKYASSPANNGPYYIDGVKTNVEEFLSRNS
jgi:hypothetical protein